MLELEPAERMSTPIDFAVLFDPQCGRHGDKMVKLAHLYATEKLRETMDNYAIIVIKKTELVTVSRLLPPAFSRDWLKLDYRRRERIGEE